MGRKVQRFYYNLDPGEIKSIPYKEIESILVAADPLIMNGGRTLLVKVLKGSKDKIIYELDLNSNPSYGIFKKFSKDEILNKIDWLILNDYLAVEYDNRLPLILYNYRGWEIIKEYKINEIIKNFNKMIDSCENSYDMLFLKDRNREIIFELLDRISVMSENSKYLPLLYSWHDIDYKKVRNRLKSVIKKIENNDL